MKEFYQQMGKYFARYKGYIISTFGMNVLAAIFNVFSFSILIPILQILFKVNTEQYELLPWSSAGSIDEFVDVATAIQQFPTNISTKINKEAVDQAFIDLGFQAVTIDGTPGYYAIVRNHDEVRNLGLQMAYKTRRIEPDAAC